MSTNRRRAHGDYSPTSERNATADQTGVYDDATIPNWYSLAAAVCWQARIDLGHPDEAIRHSAERFMDVAHIVFDG